MLMITGATGHLGSAVLDHLLRSLPASSLAALARTPEKLTRFAERGVSVRQGDYKDPASLRAAFADVDLLFFVSSGDVAGRTEQHHNVVAAAVAAGVKHVIYTSFQRKNDSPSSPIHFISESHLAAETALKSSGMVWTILKNGIYADGLPMFIGEKVLEHGIALPAGSGTTTFTVRADLALASANVLLGSGHEGKTYEFGAPAAYSYAEIAAMISRISGKNVGYRPLSVEEFRSMMTAAGVPAIYIGIIAGFSQAIEQGEFSSTESDLERFLGRPATALEDFLKSVYTA